MIKDIAVRRKGDRERQLDRLNRLAGRGAVPLVAFLVKVHPTEANSVLALDGATMRSEDTVDGFVAGRLAAGGTANSGSVVYLFTPDSARTVSLLLRTPPLRRRAPLRTPPPSAPRAPPRLSFEQLSRAARQGAAAPRQHCTVAAIVDGAAFVNAVLVGQPPVTSKHSLC